MYHAIQHGYYLNAQNPSELTTLIEFAKHIGLDEQAFKERIESESINQQLMQEISFAQQLPIQGFPSLVLKVNGQHYAIKLHYLEAQKTLHHIQSILSNHKCFTWLKKTLLK
ncbi:DsbA family protein [Psychromonas sp. KJ10-10]|uniref:DsbA family protein n=1 Tax=Psychromonas sp. KJ10-10 TaxID=3391823 RepID=UPI0039B4CF34